MQTLWAVTGDSTANTAKTITQAAEAGKKHVVTDLEVAISAAAVGTADITVELKDGTTLKWKTIIGAAAARGARIEYHSAFGIELSDNAAANLVVSAGGTAVVTHLNMGGYTHTG